MGLDDFRSLTDQERLVLRQFRQFTDAEKAVMYGDPSFSAEANRDSWEATLVSRLQAGEYLSKMDRKAALKILKRGKA